MLIRSVENEDQTMVALGGGELIKDWLALMRAAKCSYVQESEKSLLIEFPEFSISGIVVRPGDVPKIVKGFDGTKKYKNGSSRVPFGITGLDGWLEWLLSRQNRSSGIIQEVTLPQPYACLPSVLQPNVTLFRTPLSTAKNQQELLSRPGVVVTTLPNITKDYLKRQNANRELTIFEVGGKAERLYEAIRGVMAVIDVRKTKSTANANGLEEVAEVMKVVYVGLLEKSASPIAIRRINDFIEALTLVQQIEQ